MATARLTVLPGACINVVREHAAWALVRVVWLTASDSRCRVVAGSFERDRSSHGTSQSPSAYRGLPRYKLGAREKAGGVGSSPPAWSCGHPEGVQAGPGLTTISKRHQIPFHSHPLLHNQEPLALNRCRLVLLSLDSTKDELGAVALQSDDRRSLQSILKSLPPAAP